MTVSIHLLVRYVFNSLALRTRERSVANMAKVAKVPEDWLNHLLSSKFATFEEVDLVHIQALATLYNEDVSGLLRRANYFPGEIEQIMEQLSSPSLK